jgi:hypothetical protein
VKRLLPVFATAAALFVIGCASEGPTAEELQGQFERGVRGEGQVTPDIDRTGDPYVKPREGRPVPRDQ